jgi:hypothetical protein
LVKGLERFREHFKEFADRYVLIGGAACDLAFSDAGLAFRATKDLDIVLCVEALDAAFAKAFWAFVTQGGYEFQETCTGEKKFYRFKKPKEPDFPFMLELFSRVPDALGEIAGGPLTPIPVDDEVSSLSAILLDGDYYAWIHSAKREVSGIPIVVGPLTRFLVSAGTRVGATFFVRHQVATPSADLQCVRPSVAWDAFQGLADIRCDAENDLENTSKWEFAAEFDVHRIGRLERRSGQSHVDLGHNQNTTFFSRHRRSRRPHCPSNRCSGISRSRCRIVLRPRP